MTAVLAGALAIGGCAGGEDTDGGFGTLPPMTTPPMTTTPQTGGDATTDPTGESTSAGTGTSEASAGTSTGEPATSSTTDAPPACGDGKLDALEECDDGNDVETDACLSTCVAAACGDGVVHEGVEGCDDGNAVDDDACTNTCATASCGDGATQPLEECDDGNDVETDACTNMCKTAKCGDGAVQAGVEACDELQATPTCDADCSAVQCGDGAVNMAAGEQCDDGNADDSDACVACVPAKCGDGKVQAGVEQCDDGNMAGGDGCEANCTPTPMPPECVNYTTLSDADRSVNAINAGVVCDNPFNAGWYRFTGAAGTKMPNTAPQTYACGTHAPGWMNGPYPAVNEGAVARTMCFHWNNNTCNWSEPGQVRNCGQFYVFYLKNVSWGCSGRYCGTP